MRALYAGTFDPPTVGHMDVIDVAARIFDELIVLVSINPGKGSPMFSESRRAEMISEAAHDACIPMTHDLRVLVARQGELTADAARRLGCGVLVRSLRLTTEYEKELELALANAAFQPSIPTVFLCPRQEHIHVSSTLARTLIVLQGTDCPKLAAIVPPAVLRIIDMIDPER